MRMSRTHDGIAFMNINVSAIRAAEEEKEDSSTIPFVMEDETTTSVAAPTGPTSFPLNMSLDEPSK